MASNPSGKLQWKQFATLQPELADFAEARFREGVAFLATIRNDGSPRVHPVSPDVLDGRLLIFMEPTSPKGRDLLRDPRYTLHAWVAPGGDNGEFVCHGVATQIVGQLRSTLGKKGRNVLDRWVLYELTVDEALRTIYAESRPNRTRWSIKDGVTVSQGLPVS
jgi:hypothetical protein